MPRAKAADSKVVEIPEPDITTVHLVLVGDKKLVMHAWSQKSRKMIEDAQSGAARKKKEPRDPDAEFNAARYVSKDGWDGIPAISFKKSAVGACRYVEGIPMTQARGVIFVEHDGVDQYDNELIRIMSDPPVKQEDTVRLPNGNADLRYRPRYDRWYVNIRVRFNSNVISQAQVINLFSLAGLHCGVGEGRPNSKSNTMDWGMFHIAQPEELERLGIPHTITTTDTAPAAIAAE